MTDETVIDDSIERDGAPLLMPLLGICVAIAVVFPAGLPVVVAIAIGALAASYWIGKANIANLHASVETPSAAFAWESVPFQLVIGNDQRWVASRDILLGQSLARENSRRLFSYQARIDPMEEIGMSVPVRLPKRGRWRTFYLSFESTYPLGLVRWRRRIRYRIDMLALPKLGEVRSMDDVLPRAAEFFSGQSTHQISTQGEFYAVREWRPGMSQRQICWKATARRQRVMIRQNQARQDPPIHIVLHLAPHSRSNNRGRSQFEIAVSMAATLSEYLLRHRRAMRMTLLGSTAQTWQPKHGRFGLNEVLTRLAEVETDRQSPAAIPEQYFDGSATIFISAEKLPELRYGYTIRQVTVPRRAQWRYWFRRARALPSRSRLRTPV